MPDVWMPGAVIDPGKGAGYRVGRNAMRLVCIHATAGNNSYWVVKNGVDDAPSTLAQFLVPLDGPPWQFTEIDALCYDSPPNQDGPGIEIERPVLVYDGERRGLSTFRPMSPSQVYWTGRIVAWLHDEWGVPLELYDGPRVHGGLPGYYGFANHGDIDNQRSDGVTRDEWDAILAVSAPAPPPPPIDQEVEMFYAWGPLSGQTGNVVLVMAGSKCVGEFTGLVGAYGLPQTFLDWRAVGGGRDKPPIVVLDGEMMGNCRWTGVQAGAGLV